MSMHNRHEHMPPNAVLADNCPRCEEHARNPFSALDDSNLARLVIMERKFLVNNIRPSTTNDWIAITKIRDLINTYERAMNVATMYEYTHIPAEEKLINR